MNVRPNAFQRFFHRLLMLPSVTAFIASRAHRWDKAILKLTDGKHTLSEFLGWNMIQLTTIGAKSGQPRTMPLIAIFDDEKIALIASSFGRRHNPAWYYNLKAHPECEVRWNERAGTYIARETSGEEYTKYWELGISSFAGYEKHKERAPHRHIPVMVLEPKR
jgi:deazaflavin-dependent oxidoreductase (nitroreductase family)